MAGRVRPTLLPGQPRPGLDLHRIRLVREPERQDAEVVWISKDAADAAGKRVLGRDQARSRLTGVPARRSRVEHEAVHGFPAGVVVRPVYHLEASLARNAGKAVAERIGEGASGGWYVEGSAQRMLEDDPVELAPAVVVEVRRVAVGSRESVAGEQGQPIGDALQDDDVAAIRRARDAGNIEEVDARFAKAAADPELLEEVPERGEREGVRRRRQARRAEDAIDGVRDEPAPPESVDRRGGARFRLVGRGVDASGLASVVAFLQARWSREIPRAESRHGARNGRIRREARENRIGARGLSVREGRGDEGDEELRVDHPAIRLDLLHVGQRDLASARELRPDELGDPSAAIAVVSRVQVKDPTAGALRAERVVVEGRAYGIVVAVREPPLRRVLHVRDLVRGEDRMRNGLILGE